MQRAARHHDVRRPVAELSAVGCVISSDHSRGFLFGQENVEQSPIPLVPQHFGGIDGVSAPPPHSPSTDGRSAGGKSSTLTSIIKLDQSARPDAEDSLRRDLRGLRELLAQPHQLSEASNLSHGHDLRIGQAQR
jgi:hypothetical protein